MLTLYWRNKCLNAARDSLATANSLTVKGHSADPGVNGTSGEIAGMTDVVAFAASTAGKLVSTESCSLPSIGASTVRFLTLWDGANHVGTYDIEDEPLSAGASLLIGAGDLEVTYS